MVSTEYGSRRADSTAKPAGPEPMIHTSHCFVCLEFIATFVVISVFVVGWYDPNPSWAGGKMPNHLVCLSSSILISVRLWWTDGGRPQNITDRIIYYGISGLTWSDHRSEISQISDLSSSSPRQHTCCVWRVVPPKPWLPIRIVIIIAIINDEYHL